MPRGPYPHPAVLALVTGRHHALPSAPGRAGGRPPRRSGGRAARARCWRSGGRDAILIYKRRANSHAPHHFHSRPGARPRLARGGLMLLNQGDKILVAHRRLFEKDEVRFFVGCVEAHEAGVIKVAGHCFVRDPIGGRVAERTEILSLSAGTHIVYQLPDAVTVASIRFQFSEGRLSLKDGKGFTMTMNDF